MSCFLFHNNLTFYARKYRSKYVYRSKYCEHVLIVNIRKQKKTNFADSIKKIREFQDLKFFYKNKKLLNTNFVNFDHS